MLYGVQSHLCVPVAGRLLHTARTAPAGQSAGQGRSSQQSTAQGREVAAAAATVTTAAALPTGVQHHCTMIAQGVQCAQQDER
jgi:hypothetical protein